MPGLMIFTGRYYSPPFDEGVKLVARNLHLHLARLTDVFALTTASEPPEDAIAVPNNPWRLFRGVRRICDERHPDVVLYVPDAYLDRHTLARAALLRLAARAPVVMVTLMPGQVDWLVRTAMYVWSPAKVFPSTDSEAELYRRHGVRTWVLPPAVDTERFRPPRDDQEKRSLRRKYGLPEDDKLCLHVGHFRRSRNIEWLVRLRLPPGARLVVAGRRSRPGEDDMSGPLRDCGAIILDTFIPAIEEVYRAADVYLFPTQNVRAAIAMPLSVLEAMASNLRVVTTPFGGLPIWFSGVAGVYFAGSPQEYQEAAVRALADSAGETRRAVASRSWENLAEFVWDRIRRAG